MSKEAGPRERRLREQREARYAQAQEAIKLSPLPKRVKKELEAEIAIAATKTGKSRKAKK